MAELDIRHEGVPAQTVTLGEGTTTIGRAEDNDVVIPHPSVSRHHAVIEAAEGGFVLRDLESSNGTWVRGRRITEHHLAHGDTIRFGAVEAAFRAAEEPEPGATVKLDASEMPLPPAAGAAPGPTQAPPQAPPPPQAAPPQAPPPPPKERPSPQTPPPPPPPRPAPPQPPAAATTSPRPAEGELAGFGVRLVAYLIDAAILWIALLVVLLPAGWLISRGGIGILAGLLLQLAAVAGAAAYPLYFWATRGATPGKAALRLRVVREDGVEPPGWGTAALRLVGYMASGMVFGFGYLMILFDAERRGLHDMIARTRVIRVP